MDAWDAQRVICFPKGSSNDQYRDIVVTYLRDNPAQRHMTASVLGLVALRSAFPCAQK
jgi:hypothetical protein